MKISASGALGRERPTAPQSLPPAAQRLPRPPIKGTSQLPHSTIPANASRSSSVGHLRQPPSRAVAAGSSSSEDLYPEESMEGDKVGYRCSVEGLASATDESALEEAFRPFGDITESKIVIKAEEKEGGGGCGGCGYVSFATEQSMRDAIAGMNGKELNGCSITVSEAPRGADGPPAGREGFSGRRGGFNLFGLFGRKGPNPRGGGKSSGSRPESKPEA